MNANELYLVEGLLTNLERLTVEETEWVRQLYRDYGESKQVLYDVHREKLFRLARSTGLVSEAFVKHPDLQPFLVRGDPELVMSITAQLNADWARVEEYRKATRRPTTDFAKRLRDSHQAWIAKERRKPCNCKHCTGKQRDSQLGASILIFAVVFTAGCIIFGLLHWLRG